MDPLVMLILVPLGILLVFALFLGLGHPREGSQIVGKSISEESDADRTLRRHDRWRRRRLGGFGRERGGGSS